eukprot:TRINITY_DN1325_c0_g2_i1.p1 TRINITY_DN1325_c0_g2~~TRINITY_DN1325_c0_g2_i1.p1  ORF type:complete len:191 (+),score=14.34 TRINITY_DN1325_c0_g2_i1:64-636(+)
MCIRDRSYSVSQRINSRGILQRPFLHNIPFGTTAVERKNVFKHLIRFLVSTLNLHLNYYQDNLLKEGFSEQEIESIKISLDSLNKREKYNGKGRGKNYAKTIDTLCTYWIGLHTLQLTLILWKALMLSIFRDKNLHPILLFPPKGRKIRKSNISIYKNTVKCLSDAIKAKLDGAEISLFHEEQFVQRTLF